MRRKREFYAADPTGHQVLVAMVEWGLVDGCFSIMGEAGGCMGQCYERIEEYAIPRIKGADHDLLKRMVAIWRRWHLNDMRPGCRHQMGWDFLKRIEVLDLTWSDKFRSLRTNAEEGTASIEEYQTLVDISPVVMRTTIGIFHPRWRSPEVNQLLEGGWIEIRKAETKDAGWVNVNEHPDGLLGKECPECGYKYGTGWRKEELPPEVVEEIESWIGEDIKEKRRSVHG